MKKILCILVIAICVANTVVVAQEVMETPSGNAVVDEKKPEWGGVVRFKPVTLALSALLLQTPEFVVDFVPHISDEIGIPLSLGIAYSFDGMTSGAYGIGAMAGIEITPLAKFSPGGLFFIAQGGPVIVGGPYGSFLTWGGNADIGWQFISRGGFVFTPAAGAKFLSFPPYIRFGLMLDLGFAVPK